jgi:predicted dinucleotide-binding enzyme
MKIGIIGSGIVGRVLAKAFWAEGYEVTIGTRNPDKEDLVKFKTENPLIKISSFESATVSGDLLVLAVNGSSAMEAIALCGPANFSGKTVIDATNPIAKDAPVNGVLSFFTTYNSSLMEQIQEQLPAAKLVKAFNSVGNAFMYKPDFNGIKPTMFICGNDEGAKKSVTSILDKFGWETEDMGKAESARAIEPLCMLWCIPGFLRNQWTHAFKLLKK